jgi:hypothetical protein
MSREVTIPENDGKYDLSVWVAGERYPFLDWAQKARVAITHNPGPGYTRDLSDPYVFTITLLNRSDSEVLALLDSNPGVVQKLTAHLSEHRIYVHVRTKEGRTIFGSLETEMPLGTLALRQGKVGAAAILGRPGDWGYGALLEGVANFVQWGDEMAVSTLCYLWVFWSESHDAGGCQDVQKQLYKYVLLAKQRTENADHVTVIDLFFNYFTDYLNKKIAGRPAISAQPPTQFWEQRQPLALTSPQ